MDRGCTFLTRKEKKIGRLWEEGEEGRGRGAEKGKADRKKAQASKLLI